MSRILLTTLLQIAGGGTILSADRPERLLPKDGAWAKYEFSFTEEGRNQTGTLRFKMVGTTQRAGRECRWLEVELVDHNDAAKNVVLKSLVYGNEAAGRAEGIKLLEAWSRKHSGENTQFDSFYLAYLEQFILSIFFTVPSDSESFDSGRLIKLPKASLKIARAVRGDAKLPGGFEATKTVWRHGQVPFVFAAIKYSAKNEDRLIVDMSVTVTDFGTGAQTALPDHK